MTLPFHTNYGGILQAFALQTVLERLGNEVYFVRRQRDKLGIWTLIKDAIKDVFCFLLPPQKIPNSLFSYKKKKSFRRFLKNRIKEYFLRPNSIYYFNTLIVGSDQVWRPWGDNWDIMFYFLDFAKGWKIKKISYAASFGVNTWDFKKDTTEQIKSLLSTFNAISVREKDAVSLIKEKLFLDAELVLDPTMLLTKEEYNKELRLSLKSKEKLIAYILDNNNEKQRIVDCVSRELNCAPYYIDNTIVQEKRKEKLLSIENWLESFIGADTIVTDSFHGTVFSINFNKNFIVLSNHFRGQSRILSVLTMFGLEKRLVKDMKEAEEVLKMSIDWTEVNMKLERERSKSIDFLKLSI